MKTHVAFSAIATMLLSLLTANRAAAQLMATCVENSPERRGEIGCSIIENKLLPDGLKEPLFWHIDRFDSAERARTAVGPASVAFEAAGTSWLVTIESQTSDHHGGRHVARVGPLQLPRASKYSMQVMSAAFTPGLYSLAHHHSGVEAIYVIKGEACYETPTRAFKLRKGETLALPGGTPMRAVVTGSTLRYVLSVIVYDAAQPPTMRMEEGTGPRLVACRSPGNKQLTEELLNYHNAELKEARNVDVVREWYGLLDKQAFDSWSNLFTEDSKNFIGSTQQSLNYKSIIPAVKSIYTAFPDFSHKIENIFASHDYVVAQVLCTGTHMKTYIGIPPTNNKVAYKETFIFKMKNGKIQETYGMVDNLTMMKQLGLELK